MSGGGGARRPGASEARPTFGAVRLAEETRERFLREIAARVPLTRLVELHLFPPIRQGGVESGVAVLAATLEVPDAPEAPDASPAEVSVDPAPIADAVAAQGLEPAPTDAAPDADPTEAAAGVPSGDEPTVEVGDEAASEELPTAESPVGDAPAAEGGPAPADAGAEPAAAPPATPRRRLTVFTARYRLLLKGPDRGRWDVEVREEADAPLVTVEAVVRGVQQRAGDAADPERLDAPSIARLLGIPLADAAG